MRWSLRNLEKQLTSGEKSAYFLSKINFRFRFEHLLRFISQETSQIVQKRKNYSHLPRFTSIPAPISASARGRHNNQPSPSAKNIKNLINCRPQACNLSNFLYLNWKNPISFCLLANDVAVFENLYKQKNPFLAKKIVLLRFRFRLLMPKKFFFFLKNAPFPTKLWIQASFLMGVSTVRSFFQFSRLFVC